MPGTGALAQALLDAGAPVDGDPTDFETPLMTAASYGDAEVARVLVEAGADLSATAAPGAGGVPGGTALRHAAVFGMADVAEVLLAAGATEMVQAAAAGDVSLLLRHGTPEGDRVEALRIAAQHGRLDVVDRLLAAGADPGRRDPRFSSTPLGWCRHRREEVGPGHGHDEVEAVLAPITPGEA